MSLTRNVPFKITSMDSLGQGVSKVSDKVTFIPKTTVGDEGEAVITAEKKGVAFAQVKKFTQQSPERQVPPCPHFENCPSCHYQHIPYTAELKFKHEALEKLFYKVKTPPIEVIGSPQRLEYRNRVQLHYDTGLKKLGMFDIRTNQILAIPQCMIGLPEINQAIKELYQDDKWLSEAPRNPGRGHVELYWINQELKVTWNKPYADGGFTQVYEAMNRMLKEKLKSWTGLGPDVALLDLFAGNGNLSDGLSYSKRLCVDMYAQIPGENFISQDLYHEKALRSILDQLNRRQFKPTSLLLDPPRSGLKDLKLWLDAFKPESVAYVSCDPHTMIRDVASLTDYEVTRTFLIDFFPSTFHFETMLFLEKKT
ncbi:MAG TPA: hypothetical protein VNJ08_06595 [Bacteriovoracaceae bacterium]|nr:hypothetical protein [Bacteriovoracaceae bacterium]